MTLALPQEKVSDIQNKCTQLIASSKTSIMELTKLQGKLSFTAQAVLPGKIQCRYLQQQQIQAVIEKKFLTNQNKIKPTVTGRVEVVEGKFASSERQTTENRNVTLNNPTDAAKTGWGRGSLLGNHHGGNLVISGKEKTYQCFGAHCIENCNIDLY